MTVETTIFWVAVALVAYAYVGYPLLLAALGAVFGRPWRKDTCGADPDVTLIVPAHNEESVIGQKIRNCLDLDYPRDKFEIIVVCDGCTDATADVARRERDPRVRLIEYSPRRGKPAALNAACAAARGDILVFSDADVRLHAAALKHLVANFADKHVGCVSGRTLVETRAESTAQGERLKYTFDRLVRLAQSRLWTLAGADGGLYAIRRALYRPPALNAVADDLAIPAAIVEQGYRIVYDPLAAAIEPAAGTFGDEMRRKARIVAGAAPISVRWLAPRRLFRRDLMGFHLLSGKLLKYVVPLWLIAILACSVALRSQPLYAALLYSQLAFYAIAAAGLAVHRRYGTRLPRAFWLPAYFCGVNGAALVGLYRALRRRQSVKWERPPRAPETKTSELERVSTGQTPQMNAATDNSTLRIGPFEGAAAEWNEFVAAAEDGTVFHDLRWRTVIEDVFGYKSHYLEARDDGKLVGVLPLFCARHALTGPALVSMPFLNYGGPVAETAAVREALLSRGTALARRADAAYLEVRSREPLGSLFMSSTHKETYELSLEGGPEAAWRGLKSSVRNKVRKAVKLGVTVRMGMHFLPQFYRCFAHNMRDLGTPVLSRTFFERAAEAFPEECAVMVAQHGERFIGGKFVMMWGGVMYFVWASSLRPALRFAPNDLLNWRAIEYACTRGLSRCDFGRSTVGSPHAAYKRQWGAQPRQLYWEYYAPNGYTIPGPTRDRGSAYRYASLLWRRLPMPIANRLGPLLARYLP